MTTDGSSPPTVLVEHKKSRPIRLSPAELDSLRALAPRIAVAPTATQDFYVLDPGNTVGALQLGERRFVLRPKIEVRRLLFLLSYSMDSRHWHQLDFEFAGDEDLFEALIPGFVFQLERALRHGPLNGYRLEEAPLQTVRGRIRVGDQLRTSFGLVPPVECSYDEFTDDILVNRLLKAAIVRLGEVRLRNESSRVRLRALASAFSNVSAVAFDPLRLPEVHYDRLNAPFRKPVELAKLILRSLSFDASPGGVGGASFLLDLAKVFEDFFATALREALGLSSRSFPRQSASRPLFLDAGEMLRLRPDLSWWQEDRCVFVGDVKYKRTPPTAGVQHPDLYQLLAYATATGLPKGLLVYAAGEEIERIVRIPMADKEIDVVTLNLSRDPDDVLAQIERIAALARSHTAAVRRCPRRHEPQG